MALGFDPDNGDLLTSFDHYYNLDGNSTDSKGAFDGTDTNVSYSGGKISDAADGTNATAKIDFGTFQLGSACSIAFWLKFTDSSGTEIINFDNANPRRLIAVRMAATAGKIRVDTYDGTGAGFDSVTTGMDDGVWRHIVVTKIGTSGELFINGTSDATGTLRDFNPGGDGNAFFWDTINNGFYANTFLDEVGFWSKVLSQTEIDDLVNGGAGNAYRELPVTFIPKMMIY